MNEEETVPVKQQSIREKRIAQLAPWQYKKGQSGNPDGRYKGGKSGKERMKQKIAGMSDEEFEEFIEGIAKLDLFKMAEGNPESSTDLTSNGEGLAPILVKFIDASNNGKNNRDTSGVQKPI